MIASPPIETAVDWPRPAAVSVEDISVVMPPEREITPTGPGEYDFGASPAAPPIPPILITSGTMIPRQFGPMMRAPWRSANSTICATSRRGIRSVTMTTSLTPLSIASSTASFVKAGGTVTTEPSIGPPWCSTACATVSNTGTPWTSRPSRLVQRDRPVRVGDPVGLEDLEALPLPRPGDAEDGDLLGRVVAELDAGLDHAAGDDVDPRVGDDRHHHRDLVHARLLEDELGQPARLGHRRVAADLAVVRGPAAVGADRVEQCQRAAARADHEAEVAVELGDVARDAAVVLGVDGLAGQLELGRLARLARLLLAHAELVEHGLLPRASLVLHVHVGVHGDERAVAELGQGVDLGQRHVVAGEQLRQPREDRREAGQRPARDARGGDDLLGLVAREVPEAGEVAAADLVGMGLGHLLDVDAAHGGEDHHRLLARAVPRDARVVLLLDLHAGVDEHAARLVAVDLEGQDVLGVLRGLVGRVGE